MNRELTCPSCGARQSATSVEAGQRVECARCHHAFAAAASNDGPSSAQPAKDGYAADTASPVAEYNAVDAVNENIIVVPGLEMRLVRVGPGRFSRGSEHGYPNERPVHAVTLTAPFWLGSCPVTQEQYAALMHVNPSYFTGDPLPVETVSWHEALEFCRRLTEQEQTAGRLARSHFFRLPTEAEWEYAARTSEEADGTPADADAESADAPDTALPLYCFGNDPAELEQYAWYWSNSEQQTHPVGEKIPSARGLYDLHGNVGEWCLDWYGRYPGRACRDPVGPEAAGRKVRRGGGWASVASRCRAADRIGTAPDCRCALLGFRIVLCLRGSPPYELDYRVW